MRDAHWADWGCGTLLAAKLKPSPNTAWDRLLQLRAHGGVRAAELQLVHVRAHLQHLHACMCCF